MKKNGKFEYISSRHVSCFNMFQYPEKVGVLYLWGIQDLVEVNIVFYNY